MECLGKKNLLHSPAGGEIAAVSTYITEVGG